MKILAGIAGILLGLFCLGYIGIYGSIVGLAAGWLGSLGPGNATISNWAQMVSIISWLAPLLAIMGGIITFSSPRVGAIFLGASAFLLWYMLGLGPVGKLFVLPIGATALLALISPSSDPMPRSSSAAVKASTNSDGGSNDTTPSFDRAKWNALLQYDSDIALVAEKLKPLGQKWVDEFASSYLALNDKTYLPQIEQKLFAAARAEAEAKERQRIKAAEEQKAYLQEQRRRGQILRQRLQLWRSRLWGTSKSKLLTIAGGVIVILLVTVALLYLATPDTNVANRNALEPIEQTGTGNTLTTTPRGASSGRNSMPETTRKMTLTLASGGVITVKDFIHNGVTQPDKSNAGNYFLAANAPGCLEYMPGCHVGSADDFIVYYFGAGQLFNISLEKDPLRQSRLHAENFMLHTLGITKQQMCNLNYRVGVTVYVNSEYAGPNLGFSFCPGATELPTQPGPHAVPRSG